MGCVRRVTLAMQSVNGVRSVVFDAASDAFEVTMVPTVTVEDLATRVRDAGQGHEAQLAPQDQVLFHR